jgi:hypothetical protein
MSINTFGSQVGGLKAQLVVQVSSETLWCNLYKLSLTNAVQKHEMQSDWRYPLCSKLYIKTILQHRICGNKRTTLARSVTHCVRDK